MKNRASPSTSTGEPPDVAAALIRAPPFTRIGCHIITFSSVRCWRGTRAAANWEYGGLRSTQRGRRVTSKELRQRGPGFVSVRNQSPLQLWQLLEQAQEAAQAVSVSRGVVEPRGEDGYKGALVADGQVVCCALRPEERRLQHGDLEVRGPHDEAAVAVDDRALPGALVQAEELHASRVMHAGASVGHSCSCGKRTGRARTRARINHQFTVTGTAGMRTGAPRISEDACRHSACA